MNGEVFRQLDYEGLSGALGQACLTADTERNLPAGLVQAPVRGQSLARGPIVQTAAQLRSKTFAPLKYIVPDLIVEGLVILAGKPKVRKSWLALDIGLAVASGRYCLGDRRPQQGSVLYLGLEDGERRLQRRIDKLLPTFDWPANFHYSTQWLRADQGGVEAIDKWCQENPDARLVEIDVLARFRAPANGKANLYSEDYAALVRLQELAIKRSIGVLVVHHHPGRARVTIRRKRYQAHLGYLAARMPS